MNLLKSQNSNSAAKPLRNRALVLCVTALFSALAASCGRDRTLELGEFAPYVDRFEQSALVHGLRVEVSDLVIRYGAMETAQERGACEISANRPPTIIIRQDTWQKMGEAEREELLFHELGHCVLSRKHRKDIGNEGMPKSIMNPYLIRGELYQENRDYYLRELFRPDSA